jgi:hypothetical protein
MFNHTLVDPFPWERGIEPDASNDVADVYIEEYYTRNLKKDRTGSYIKKMEHWYVGLVKFKDGTLSWIISDGTGVLEEATALEDLFCKCDKWKLIIHGKA